MTILEFENRKDLEKFILTQKEQMYELIIDAITYANDTGEDIAEVCTMHVLEEGVYIDMISKSEEWKESLSLALAYYVSEEKYETCAIIKNLIDSIL
jgi:hypothetical protein